eukprot:349655-Chlamydomonas_euryale.AAC.7
MAMRCANMGHMHGRGQAVKGAQSARHGAQQESVGSGEAACIFLAAAKEGIRHRRSHSSTPMIRLAVTAASFRAHRALPHKLRSPPLPRGWLAPPRPRGSSHGNVAVRASPRVPI